MMRKLVLLIVVTFFLSLTSAESAEKRVALVIGNKLIRYVVLFSVGAQVLMDLVDCPKGLGLREGGEHFRLAAFGYAVVHHGHGRFQ